VKERTHTCVREGMKEKERASEEEDERERLKF
jgi:hypothetical protein